MPYAIINPDTPDPIRLKLESTGFKLITLPLCNSIERQISGHPDIQLFLYDKNLFIHSGLFHTRNTEAEPKAFYNCIRSTGIKIIPVDIELSFGYRNNCGLNILKCGNVCFHNTKYTAGKIKRFLTEKEIPLLHVNQAYTNCSTLSFGNNIITSDKMIAKIAKIKNIEKTKPINVLSISPGHIDLPGYKYGFIGGCCGVYKKEIYFTGSLMTHPDSKDIINFIKSTGYNIIELSKNKLIDLGGILFISDE